MKNIQSYFIIGVFVIGVMYLLKTQENLSVNIVDRVKTKDPAQIGIAAVITVGLGMIATIGGNLLRAGAK